MSDPVVSIAITVRLPWAAASRAGHKLIENRGRPIPEKYIGRRVGIHAAAAWSKEGATDPRISLWWWGPSGPNRRLVEPGDFPFLFRRIIAVARIADCHQARPDNSWNGAYCCEPWGDPYYIYPAKVAWHIVFADMVPLGDPVGPVVGKLSVPWNLPPDIAATVSDRYLDAP